MYHLPEELLNKINLCKEIRQTQKMAKLSLRKQIAQRLLYFRVIEFLKITTSYTIKKSAQFPPNVILHLFPLITRLEIHAATQILEKVLTEICIDGQATINWWQQITFAGKEHYAQLYSLYINLNNAYRKGK